MPVTDEEKWLKVAKDFEKKWQFPHCLGSIDGKHVMIQAPPGGASHFYCYKKYHSIVLMAVADAHRRFIIVDIGECGSQADGAVFANSTFYEQLTQEKLNIPADCELPNCITGVNIPYVFLADDAFPLRKNLMKPYTKNVHKNRGKLTNAENIFNYRLSRARRVVENAFGLMCQRFRIFYRKIQMDPRYLTDVVKACVVLHNYLTPEVHDTDEDEDEIPTTYGVLGLQDLIRKKGGNTPKEATLYRDMLRGYFMYPNATEWQKETTYK
jgi:hypothetical protein